MITDTLPAALSAPEPEDPNDIGAIVRARGVSRRGRGREPR
jgi:hypothetical protein